MLVTGVADRLGGRLAGALAAHPGVERVLGVDARPPVAGLPAPAEFVRTDVRNPRMARLLADADVDTVVHTGLLAAPAAGGRSAMKERNVIGTLQLLAAAQHAPGLRRFVLQSSAAVYGASPRDPALFTEDMEPRPRGGFGRDAAEAERYARGLARRRPDVALTILRFAELLGPDGDTPLARYLARPVVSTVLGFDPRLQLCAEADALELLRRAATEDHPGTYNAAGDGVLLLSQALRRAGRIALPVPAPLVGPLGRLGRRVGLADLPGEDIGFLEHGRAVDTTRLRSCFGYFPRSTATAYDDFVRARLTPVVPPELVAGAEAAALTLLGATRRPGG